MKKENIKKTNNEEILNTREQEILNKKEQQKKQNKKDKNSTKSVKNQRISFLKQEKSKLKTQIKTEHNPEKKKELKKQYKEKFVDGNEKNTGENIIQIKNLNKFYCNKMTCEHILYNLNLEIKKGDIVVILGASGSGKSTLLNIMSGLTPPNSGDVIVADKNLLYLSEDKRTKFRADNLSFVFQSYNLIPTLTVIENIKVGEDLRSKNVEKLDINKILETLDLTEQAKKYPYQLSGGQNQRTSIGRALAKNPKLLFADEPTGALDEEKGREALQMLIDINAKYKTTLIIVTHNPNFENIADMVIRIKDGRIDSIKKNKEKTSAKDLNWS